LTDPVYSRAAWRTRTCYETRIVYNIGLELIRDAVSPPAKRKKLARRQNQGRNSRAILLKIVLHKFTNPKIRNQCCNVFEHVFHSVLLHLPYILLETTSIFTLGFFKDLLTYESIFNNDK
jgi:hypothetical protein